MVLQAAAHGVVGHAQRGGVELVFPAGDAGGGERADDALVVDRRDDDPLGVRQRRQHVGHLGPGLLGRGVEGDLLQVVDLAAVLGEPFAIAAHAILVGLADLGLLERHPRVVLAVEVVGEVLAEDVAGDAAAVGVVDAHERRLARRLGDVDGERRHALGAGLAHARRRFDIVLEVEHALGALVPEHAACSRAPVALSPLPSQNSRFTPAISACSLIPSEITCTIGTDSRFDR